MVIPDFIANAGGVICAAVEYRGGTQKSAFDYIDERIRANTSLVLEETKRQELSAPSGGSSRSPSAGSMLRRQHGDGVRRT